MSQVQTDEINQVRQAEERPMAKRVFGKSLLLGAVFLVLTTVVAVAAF